MSRATREVRQSLPPHRCAREIDLIGLQRDRDQILAEAVHRFKSGWRWHITDPERPKIVTAEQVDRYEGDAWEDSIAAWHDDHADEAVTLRKPWKAHQRSTTPKWIEPGKIGLNET